MTRTEFSGPLPHPSILADYDAVTPGLASRVVAMAEANQQHRHALETTVIASQIQLATIGQRIAGFIAVVGLLVAGALGIWGNAAAGVIFGLVNIGGLAALFVYNSQSTKDERIKKSKIMAGLP